MPALNFKARFEPLIVSGTKRQTIRALRKDGRDPKPGQQLYLYTGMRTKSCRCISRYQSCKSTHPIEISNCGGGIMVSVDGKTLSSTEVQSLAVADGFKTAREFLQFFMENHSFPFNGLLIKW